MGKLTSLILILLILVSCKKEKKNIVSKNKGEQVEYVSQLPYKFEFPDTIFRNKLYRGKLVYNGDFDSLKLKEGEKRYILYYLTKTDVLEEKINDLKKIQLDTFSSIDYHVIPFNNISFDKLGVNYIDGLIDDSAYLDVPEEEGKLRTITKITRATHKVYVVDSLTKNKN